MALCFSQKQVDGVFSDVGSFDVVHPVDLDALL
jgi:hypothetical protein